jgi:predicted pyridoxine 5'-phosphate oxidase superfamily flavin-nucleotide-binding protein
MIDKKLKTMIEKNPVAFATSDENGNPHVIAVAYVKVVGKNKLLITDNYMKKTTENLIRNYRIALAVWDKCWKGYRLKGVAKYFTSGKWKKFVEQMKENKGEPAKGAILVTIDEIHRLVS